MASDNSEEQMSLDEPSLKDKLAEAGAGAKTALEAFGVGKIIAIIIGIAAIYLFLQLPFPVTVAVQLLPLDSDKTIDSAEVTANFNSLLGPKTQNGIDSGEGRFLFRNMQSKTNITFTINAVGYKIAKSSKTFTADGQTHDIFLAKKTSLALPSQPITGSISLACSITYPIQVTNTGEKDEEAEFVVDELSDTATATISPAKKTIAPGANEEFSLAISTSGKNPSVGDEITADLRLKDSNEKLPLAITVSQTPRLDAPGDVKFSENENQLVIELKNNGETEITNIQATLSDEISDKVSIIELVPRPLKPDDELKFKIRNEGMNAGEIGFLNIDADCISRKQITVKGPG